MIENGNLPATMLVSPTGNYGGGFGGFGGDWGFLLLLLLCANGGWGMGGFGGWGGMMGMGMMDGFGLYPWLNNSQNINDGFRDQQLSTQVGNIQNSITSGFGDVQLGLAGVNQSICQTGNGITSAITGAQNAISQQMYSNEIANLNRSFAEQTANANGFNNLTSQLAQCCCDNRLATVQTQNIVQNEGNATRFADANNTRDIIDATNRGNQMILDKLCQLELDGVKAQVEAKNDRIAELTTQLNMANLAASQVRQTADIQNNIVSELRSCPIPAQPVYGSQPIFTCPNNNSGCGCQNFYN